MERKIRCFFQFSDLEYRRKLVRTQLRTKAGRLNRPISCKDTVIGRERAGYTK